MAFTSWALGAIVAAILDFIAFLSGDDEIDWMIWVVISDMFWPPLRFPLSAASSS